MAESPKVVAKREEEGVEVLTLKNPPVNALSTALLGDLAHAIDRLEADRDARCVVLTGDGTYFSAGADLKEVGTIGIEHAPAVAAKGQALFDRISRARFPVIAAINGLAVGGGLELVLACDLRVAGDSAKLGAPEVKFGLMPAYGGTQRLPRLVGAAKAKELIFTGGMVPAAEALRIGLVNKVVPSGQELRAARDLAHTIAQQAPKAVAASKRAITEGGERSLAEGLKIELDAFSGEVLPSDDLGEGIAAFLEHRPPKFKGA
jgi:enoyl-CoA hydratase/carnithine racemase